MKPKPQVYRDVIDDIVLMCREGMGQARARSVRMGVWNVNASATSLPEDHRINLLLARLSDADRKTIAGMLSEAVMVGAFEALKALEEREVAPFEDGYEGGPCEDFIGRLSGEWDWPQS